MTTSSYRTLARYDSRSRENRVRSLDDIRTRQRETLYKSRSQLKCLKMLKNRPTLAEIILTNARIPDEDYPVDEFDHVDASQWDQIVPSPWSSEHWDSNWNLNAPSDRCTSSPTLSTNSSFSSIYPTDIELADLPRCFLESASNPHDYKRSSNTSRNQQSKRALYSNNSRPLPYHDTIKLSQEFKTLQKQMKSCRSDPASISQLIIDNWQLITNVTQSKDKTLLLEFFSLLSDLANHNMIQPQAILHMLQHGLIYNLRDCLWAFEDVASHVSQLLINIVSSTPSSIPYLIELMSNSRFFSDFEEIMVLCPLQQARSMVTFYYLVGEILMSPHYGQIQPLIPDILLLTGLDEYTLESYCPAATLMKCITPGFLKLLVTKCLEQNGQDEDLVAMTLVLLANALKLTELHFNTTWELKLLEVYRSVNLSNRINSMLNDYSNKCETRFRGQCDTSSNNIEKHLRQFSAFFQQYCQLNR